jgi:leukotriene-A4 hydrolase
MTYDARVTVPKWATAVMSALSKDATKTNTVTTNYKGDRVFEFNQPVPIPSYLFALAVGELDSRDISPRCRVWSEPSMVEAVAFEFSQVEDFLVAAEELTMPYQWTRYDLLCLPPSFPYGGMENPCLTFVTPTLLAGDKSLADVVAHEAAHSWSGNLVTNETWEHFWLNEGWTIFLQRKIMTKVHGDEKFFDFDAIGGWEDLKESVALMPDKYTKLIPDLGDDDPDDAFSSVPYEKGFNLLYTLERMVGADKFAGFMKAYFDKFKFATVTSQKFVEFFETYFKDVPAVRDFDWDKALHKPGMPEAPTFDRTLSAECEGLSDAWISVDDGETVKEVLPKHDISEWSTGQKICFLDAMISTTTERKRPLSLSTIARMKEKYNMHESQNSEVLFRFCMLAVEAGDESILPIVVRFITTQGRMKFVRPLYRALFNSQMGKDIAVSTFLENKDFYHPIAAKMVASDLDPSKSEKKKEGGVLSSLQNPLVLGGVLAISAAVGIALLRGKKH